MLESGAAEKLNLAQKSASFLQLRGTSNEALKVAATMQVDPTMEDDMELSQKNTEFTRLEDGKKVHN